MRPGPAAPILLRPRRGRGRRGAGAAAAALVLACAAGAEALDPQRRVTQYVHDAWGVPQGLPQGSVQSILQSRDGYLWLGTLEGAVRFDGARFAVYDKNNTEAFRHNDVQDIAEDAEGRLWFATWNGLTVLEGGRFAHVALPPGFEQTAINALALAGDGGLWLGTAKGLLHHRQGAFREHMRGEAITALLRDASGTLWIGTNDGLSRLEQDRVLPVQGTLGQDAVLSLYQDRQGTLWVGTGRLGLFPVSPKEADRAPPRGHMPGERVWAALQDRDGNLWFATASQGVVRLRDGRWEPYGQRQGLSLDTTISLFEDREGALWIGTEGTGLDRLRDGKVMTLGAAEGLPDEYIWTVFEDRSGRIWMGSNVGGLLLLERGALRQFVAPGDPGNRRITAVAEDTSGTIWAATSGRGLIGVREGRLVPHPMASSLPPFINALFADRDGTLWVGGDRGGVFAVNAGQVHRYTRQDGLADEMVRSLTGDREGNVWVGTEHGLSRISPARFGRITTFTTREGLPHNTVLDVHVDQGGVVWIGTYGGGLGRLEQGRFTTYDRKAGLYDDVVYRILEARDGTLWMSSNRGIFGVSRKELDDKAAGRAESVRSTVFGISDGMRSVECNGWWQPAGWRTQDGRLWFPTVKGVVVVDPPRVRRNELLPPVLIERTVVDDQPVAAQEGLELEPGRRRVEFHYTGLSLLEPAKVAFRYRLDGFDEGWVEAGTRRVAYYTNLPPGRYRFRVTASNNDGVWNEQGASFALRQRPRFTQTLWFYLVLGAGVVALAYGVHRGRVAQLHLRERRLQAEVARRTQELEESNRVLAQREHQLTSANVQLERLATEDALTGLFNRRYLNEMLEKEWARALREKAQLAVVLLDVDHFKKLNDSYGHPTGDECLRKVAAVLKNAIHRPADVAARYGGEEFAMLLPSTMQAGAGVLAERIRRAVEGLRIPHRDSPFGVVTVSCGVAGTRPEGGHQPAELIEAADQALYRAKQEGRNRVGEAPAAPSPFAGEDQPPPRPASGSGASAAAKP